MNTTTKRRRAVSLPTTFEGLVGELMPCAIHDKVAYLNAMEMVQALARVPELSAGQHKYLDTLFTLIEPYEKEHYRVNPAHVTPVEMLKSFMNDHDMSGADLARLLGVSPSTASLILKGKRNLTVNHIRKLAERFRVSADVFLGA